MAESDPSPAELERQDREQKAKEAVEQAALPYKWTQTISDADVSVPVPESTRGRDLDVSLTRTRIKVGLKGQEPIVEVCYGLLTFLIQNRTDV